MGAGERRGKRGEGVELNGGQVGEEGDGGRRRDMERGDKAGEGDQELDRRGAGMSGERRATEGKSNNRNGED